MDVDGLIKLRKAGLLKLFSKTYKCLIPQAVYYEAVIKGKEELYEDAFRIEEVVEKGIEKRKAEESEQVKDVLQYGDPSSLGRGERETLHLFWKEKADAIVSDDRTFFNLLDRYNEETGKEVPFLTPANVIVMLKERDLFTKKKAKETLNKIKGLIRADIYKRALEDLETGGD